MGYDVMNFQMQCKDKIGEREEEKKVEKNEAIVRIRVQNKTIK